MNGRVEEKEGEVKLDGAFSTFDVVRVTLHEGRLVLVLSNDSTTL